MAPASMQGSYEEDPIDAKIVIESWRRHYNQVRPYSSLGNLTPAEFKKQRLQFSLHGAIS